MTEYGHDTTRKRPRWILGVAIGLLVVAATYVALIIKTSGVVPANTSVAGISLDGLSPVQAKEKLQSALGELATAPIELKVNDKNVSVDPATAGLGINISRTIDELSAKTANPITLIKRLRGGGETNLVIDIDESKLMAAVHGLATNTTVAATEPSIVFLDGQGTVVAGKPGVVLDEAKALELIRNNYMTSSADALVVPVQITQPHPATVATDYLGAAMSAVSVPVIVSIGGVSTSLTPAQLKSAVSFTYKDGKFVPGVDGEKLFASLKEISGAFPQGPVDATFKIVNGKPVVVPGVAGRGTTPEKLAASVASVITDLNSRTVVIPLAIVQPDFTTEEAKALGITDVLSTFTQHFPYAAYRVQNIGQAAKYLNGTIVQPGETFSMNDTVLERTEANGYTKGFIIGGDGLFHEDLGGGVSTATTAVWHAAFYANMVRVEQRAHSFWIARYQPGLEATVSWGSLDLKWKNPEKSGVLIVTAMTNSSITVTMYGTKTYDKVESTSSPRTNVTPYKTIISTDPQCIVQPGVNGFSITVTRVVTKAGIVASTEPFKTVYSPSTNVICRKASPSPTPKPSPSRS